MTKRWPDDNADYDNARRDEELSRQAGEQAAEDREQIRLEKAGRRKPWTARAAIERMHKEQAGME